MSTKSAYDKVKSARLISRPTALEYFENCFQDFIEFKGDRNIGDDKAVVGGIATLGGVPVTIIGIQKGHTLEENLVTNFGQVNPEGYRKALRLMKQAEKFNRPVICFVNTAGAFCGKSAEERGQGEAIARNLMEMAGLKTPIISIITGEGGSGGALALAVADRVCILKNAVYSVLSPEGFSSILWKDNTRAEEAAELMKLTADDLLTLGVVDKIFIEFSGGIEVSPGITYREIETYLIDEIKKLKSLEVEELLAQRYNRFRGFGEFKEI